LNGQASATPPTQAGFYYAVAVFNGSTNYACNYAQTTFTIAKAMPTISISDAGGTYNGSSFAATATLTGISGSPTSSLDGVSLTIIYYLNGQASATPPTQAGFYYAVAVFNGSTNYACNYTQTTFTIAKAMPAISIIDAGGTYNGSSFAATATLTGISGSPTSSLDGVSLTIIYYLNGQASAAPPTQAGFYYAVAVFNGSINYASSYVQTTFTIAKAMPTISITDAGGTHNGSPFTATATLTGVSGSPTSSLDGVSLTIIYYLNGQASATPPTQAGYYYAVAVFNGSTNYACSYAQTTFTIT
jgi:predicted metal-binding protein